jgi:membrane fusion protein (multidrug efflux system)
MYKHSAKINFMNKNNKKITVLLFIIVALGAFYFFYLKPKLFAANQSGYGQGAPEVTVVTVKKQPIQLFLELPGRVIALKTSQVRPQVDGIVRKRVFAQGSFVKEGQQLYQIEPRVYQIAFDKAKTALKNAAAKQTRYQKLLEFDAVSKQEYDDAETALAQARADFKKAKTDLTYTKVLAPISGYVGSSNISSGMLVTANQPGFLTTIVQIDPVYVDMVQPSKEIEQLAKQKGIAVSLTIDGVPYENHGTFMFSEVFVDDSTDSVRLRAEFSNKNKKLMPGMFVSAKLHLKPFDALTVPQRATTHGDDGNLIIWVVDENNIAKPRIIKASQAFNDMWIVEEGLNEGEKIIYEGFQKIADGAKVSPVMMPTEVKAEVKAEEKSEEKK